jgi:precorrin-4 methylase
MLNTCKKEIRIHTNLLAIMIFFLMSFFLQFGTANNAYGKKGESVFYLISVGVGDADLITVRAIDTIKRSDVIVCREKMKEKFAEYLKGKKFLDSSRGWRYSKKDRSKLTDKEKKARSEERRKRRAELVSKIRSQIAKGKTVSILDSGDPLIYGPKAWYLEEFKDLNPIVVPGVSCFNAANAALRKSITSGKETSSVVLTSRRDIEKMSAHHPTMVVFTMRTEFKDLITKLKNLYSSQTPIAIVVYAGYKEKESVIRGTLKNIMNKVGDEKLPFEHLIYVGDFLEQKMKRDR